MPCLWSKPLDTAQAATGLLGYLLVIDLLDLLPLFGAVVDHSLPTGHRVGQQRGRKMIAVIRKEVTSRGWDVRGG